MRIFTRHDYSKEHVKQYVNHYSKGRRTNKIKIVSRVLGNVQGKWVLDVGIGGGFFSHLCVKKKAKTVSVDFADPVMEYHKKNNAKLKLIQCDAQHLAFKDELFDVVLALDIIEHLPSVEDFLREVNRVLRTRGRVILITPNTTNLLEKTLKTPLTLARKVLNLEAGKRKHTCTHVKEFSPRELRSLFEQTEFEISAFNTFSEHTAYRILDPVVTLAFPTFLNAFKWRKAFFLLEKR